MQRQELEEMTYQIQKKGLPFPQADNSPPAGDKSSRG